MSRFAATGALCLASALVVSAWAQAPPRPSARQTLDQLRADLREAQSVAKGLTDRRARDRLELLLTRAELHASELRNAAAQFDRPPVIVAAPAPRVLTEAEFAPMVKALKDQSFDNGRLATLKSFGKTRRFTAAQVKRSLEAFSFDDDRVRAAVWLHPLLADPENFYMALEAFSFDSGRNAVRQQLKLN